MSFNRLHWRIKLQRQHYATSPSLIMFQSPALACKAATTLDFNSARNARSQPPALACKAATGSKYSSIPLWFQSPALACKVAT
ncbi:hypothetical protein [Beggiatoa leptomitoformis]|uniref:hypothetical protein n=1 Tax=Beggiatoa leptomitoformis TaxID=288004 RepID=UPI0039C8AC33